MNDYKTIIALILFFFGATVIIYALVLALRAIFSTARNSSVEANLAISRAQIQRERQQTEEKKALAKKASKVLSPLSFSAEFKRLARKPAEGGANQNKNVILGCLLILAGVWWCGVHEADGARDEARFQAAREHGWDVNHLSARQQAIVDGEAREELQGDNELPDPGVDDHAAF